MKVTASFAALAASAPAFAQLILPYAGNDASGYISSFQVLKSGPSGRANTLYITNPTNASDALLVNTVGLGRAAYFSINNASNTQMAVRGDSNGSGMGVFGLMTGTGKAGAFRIINASNSNTALLAQTDGTGTAFMAVAGGGLAGEFVGKLKAAELQVGGTSNPGWVLKSADNQGNASWAPDGFAVPYAVASSLSSEPLLQLANEGAFGVGLSGVGSGAFGVGVEGHGTGSFADGVYGVSSTGYGVRAKVTGGNRPAVFAESTSTVGTRYGLQAEIHSSDGAAVYGNAKAANGATRGVYGLSAGNFGRGLLGEASSTTGSTYGVYGHAASTSGHGVYGYASSTSGQSVGLEGRVESDQGTAIKAVAASVSGFTYALTVRNESAQGLAGSFEGKGTDAVVIDNFGDGRGLKVLTNNDTAVHATAATSGFAGYFSGKGSESLYVTNPGSGRGIRVVATADTALWATTTSGFAGIDGQTSLATGRGIFGKNNATTGVGYGVAGQATSGSGWGVFAFGNSGASGTKSFRIDHPFNPENEYLYHYSSEGPEPYNVYKGRTVTDSQGYSWIVLPDYFQEINKDVDYQLTVIDGSEDFVLAKVTREVAENRFQIRTSKPRVTVCWEVKAVRNDAWVRRYGAPVEVPKQGTERGTYQHPELYGKKSDRGINAYLGTKSAMRK